MSTALNPQTAPNVSAALAHGRRLLEESPDLAAQQAREILRSVPGNPEAYRLLAAALRQTGDDEDANEAELAAIAASKRDPELLRAGAALVDNDLPAAEAILRAVLKRRATDVAAIRMMAELAARIGRRVDAENLLRRAIELAPGWVPARANLATVLYRQHRAVEALAELDKIEMLEAADDAQRNLRAAALGQIGGYQEAVSLYRDVLARRPDQPKIWMSLGHMLKTVGEQAEAITAYRRAIEIAPALGEVWWSLANLKTVRFSDEDIATMRSALNRNALSDDDRLHLHFALGKALEDRHEDEPAFAEYAEGNRIRAGQLHYDPSTIAGHVDVCETLFTREFLDSRAGQGCEAPDPIFVLGLPRSGSTLIEQILSSHPAIEGTMELPNVLSIAKSLADEFEDRVPAIAALPQERLVELGERYIRETRSYRKSDRPFFIDKMPNNWLYVPLIHLMLPNARIIDARRHPLACCFSNFKQNYARGQTFSYDLQDLGTYYANYVRMMAHVDAVLPGKVHRLFHEDMVDDTESEIRRLLDYLGLPFDENCLRFHENARAVRTASAEQVRRPINREGVDQWRDYEPWLGPLKDALGPVLTSYPDVPPFAQ